MGDALDGVGLAVGPVVHRVDAPLVAGVLMLGVQDAVHHRVAQVDVRRAPCRSWPAGCASRRGTRRPACGGTGRGSPRRSGCDTGCPCRPRSSVPRYSRDLLGRQVADVRLALLDELLGPVRRAARNSRRRSTVAVPVEAEPADVFLDGIDVLLSSLVGLVSSKRRLHLPPYFWARPKLRQIDLAWPMCR